MIVTYALSLRGGGNTIVIPPFTSGNNDKLLEHIRTHCILHYNSTQLFHRDHLKNNQDLTILLIHP